MKQNTHSVSSDAVALEALETLEQVVGVLNRKGQQLENSRAMNIAYNSECTGRGSFRR